MPTTLWPPPPKFLDGAASLNLPAAPVELRCTCLAVCCSVIEWSTSNQGRRSMGGHYGSSVKPTYFNHVGRLCPPLLLVSPPSGFSDVPTRLQTLGTSGTVSTWYLGLLWLVNKFFWLLLLVFSKRKHQSSISKCHLEKNHVGIRPVKDFFLWKVAQ